MGAGGQLQGASSGAGGALQSIAQYWPALNSSLQRNEAVRQQNEQRGMEIGQQKAEGSLMAGIAGGYDPATGITWNGPSADPSKNPLADVSRETTGSTGGMVQSFTQDPVGQLAMRMDPKGVMSSIVQRAFAPPQAYQMSKDGQTKSGLLTMAQAMRMQQDGWDLNYEEKSKPLDLNQAPTIGNVVGADGRNQGTIWRPGMAAPQNYGGEGDFAMKAPEGDLGQILGAQRFMGANGGIGRGNFNGNPNSASFGGGTNLGDGSGAPNNGQATGGGQATPGGGYNAATGQITAPQKPWVSMPIGASQNQPQSIQQQLNGILQTKLTVAGRTPEQQAALTKTEEAKVAPYGEAQKLNEKSATDQQAFEVADDAFTRLADSAKALRESKDLNKSVGSIDARTASFFPGAVNTDAAINNLRGQVALSALQAARQGSATGATGFGALSEKELDLLQNSIASLDPKQDEGTFRSRLQEIETHARKMQSNLRSARLTATGGKISPQSGWSIQRVN